VSLGAKCQCSANILSSCSSIISVSCENTVASEELHTTLLLLPRQQRADSRQQRADSKEQRADSRQQTADSRQQRADRPLLARSFMLPFLYLPDISVCASTGIFRRRPRMVLEGSSSGVRIVLEGSSSGVRMVLEGSSSGVRVVLEGSSSGARIVLEGC
jgi:hypothetical protein